MRFLTISEREAGAALSLIQSSSGLIEGAEIRFDYAIPEQWESFLSLPCKTDLPLIASARLPGDGGRWSYSEERRRELLLQASKAGFSSVDLEGELPGELFTAVRELLERGSDQRRERAAQMGGGKAPGTPLSGTIASYHRFAPLGGDEGIPGLYKVIEELESKGEIPKMAVMISSSADLLAFTRFSLDLKQRPGHRILIGMGAYGVPVRIAYHAFGSILSFCSLSSETPAPGQLSPELLESSYRLGRFASTRLGSPNREYSLFGIAGNPVLHSRSPEIHNPGFERLKIPALYLPFPVDDLESFMETAKLLGVRGFSVTAPHKEQIIPLLDRIDPLVEEIGSCNTVVFEKGSRGTNTDYVGFLKPLQDFLGEEGMSHLATGKVLLIGAGGVARTVLIALRDLAGSILVANRNREKAAALVKELLVENGGAVSLADAAAAGPYSLIVQTTPVGMSPDDHASPIPDFPFTGDEMVYDLIYAPEKTAFLIQAQSAGCRVLGGLAMLREQAYEQFRLFTGCDYPLPGEQRGSSSVF